MRSGSPFPRDFVWGAGTSAYQVEGATRTGGRGLSDWDDFAALPGRIEGGDTADVATDYYHRYRTDLDLARDASLDIYRFSLSWSRIVPEPGSTANRAGLDFYSSVLDETLARGLTPFVTLSHMDIPLWLARRGGWASRDSVDRFAEYAEIVTTALGDRVGFWVTLNEIPLTTWNGYGTGKFPPGGDLRSLGLPAIHHQLLAHAHATNILRSASATTQVGLVGSVSMIYPADPADTRDVQAASRVDDLLNRSGTDPVFLGSYSDQLMDIHRSFGGESFVQDGDMDTISTPIDFYGINYYTPTYVTHDASGLGNGNIPAGVDAKAVDPGHLEKNSFGWLIEPKGLTDAVRRFSKEYGTCVFITENGTATDDVVDSNGNVDDPGRVSYLASHISAVADALEEGADIRGYIAWSLTDNFEWAAGRSKRFGLVYVDYSDQKRIPKTSYFWFRDFIDRFRDEATVDGEPVRHRGDRPLEQSTARA